jgi:FkbM family methyltransferase
MSFISYAQNFEDVMLWRALKHVKNGVYIDVGANDPTLYSVTRAFYDAGWSGINIEPVPAFQERLREQRPRDTNLRVGAGNAVGAFPFYNIPESGLATSDAAIAQKHRENGWEVETIEIPVLPLAQICEEHVTGDIHFLKIDVEGTEKNVLEGMDFKLWRPWILVIEATAPMSQQTAHHVWEHIVTTARYEFVYFDGLNRYYIAEEHANLKSAFATPPNVFDGFVLNADQESKLRASEAEVQAAQLRQKAVDTLLQVKTALGQAEESYRVAEAARQELQQSREFFDAQLADAEGRVRAAEAAQKNAELGLIPVAERAIQAERELASVYASTSWRITRPVRTLKVVLENPSTILQWSRRAVIRAKGVCRTALIRSVRVVLRQPVVRSSGVRMLARFPLLNAKIRALRARVIRSELARMDAAEAASDARYYHSSLSRSASRMLDELKRNIEKNRK